MSDPLNLSEDRLPPHSIQCEQGAIGCQLLSPKTCIAEVVSSIGAPLLDCDANIYYDLRHQVIQQNLCEMADAGQSVDLITLQQKLKDKGILEQCGGITYLTELQDAVPSAENLSYYLDILKEKYRLRRMIRVCTEAVAKAFDLEGEAVDGFLDTTEKAVLQVRGPAAGIKSMTQLALAAADYMETRFKTKGALGGISTGYARLDYYTDGLVAEYIVLGGFSSTGKTSFALNLVENICIKQGLPTLFFSQEMSAESLARRLINTLARISKREVQDGNLSEQDFMRAMPAVQAVSKAPLHIDETKSMSIQLARARARRYMQQHGIKFIVADYLQKFSDPEKAKRGNREQEIASVSNGFFEMAHELNVPVLVLSQLNKDGQARESRSVFMDSDKSWVLKNVEEDPDKRKGLDILDVDLDLEKDRDGEAGVSVPLVFFKRITKFEPRSDISESDVPETKRYEE